MNEEANNFDVAEYKRSLGDLKTLNRIMETTCGNLFCGVAHRLAEGWWWQSLSKDEPTVPLRGWVVLLAELRRARRVKQCSTALVVDVIQRVRAARLAQKCDMP